MASISENSVAIILVNWNGYAFSQACLNSLNRIDFPNYQVVLVDNASEENEGERLLTEFPEIHLIQSEKNRGFTGGNNLGIQWAVDQGFPHVLLLNNDTEVEPDFLSELMKPFRRNEKVGAVQPLITFLTEKEKIWSAGGKWNSILGRAITIGGNKSLKTSSLNDQKMDWATGCAFLVSAEIIRDVGMLDDRFFTYFEDVDWSLRIREKGHQIHFCPQSRVYHEAGASSKKKGKEGTLSPRVFHFHSRNQLFLIRKHLSGFSFLASMGYHGFRFLLWIIYFSLRGRIQKVKAVATGVRDGLTLPLEHAEKWQ